MTALNQILGMARAEFWLHWRRRGLVVITLSLIVLPAMGALYVRGQLAELNRLSTAPNGLPAGATRDPVTIAIIYGTWAAVYMVLAMLLPPVMADAIPRDRQLGMRELLDSLPLTTATYLAGKLLGAWLSIAAGLAAAMLVIGALWVALVGQFNVWPYVQMWLIGALGLSVANAALAVLLAGGQPNRRRAVFVGVAMSIALLYLLTVDLQSDPGSARALLSLARPALFNYYITSWVNTPLASFGNSTTLRHVWLTLLAGGGEALVAAVGLWAWMRWRDERI